MKNVVKDYEKGMSVKEISERNNITESQVRSFLKTQIKWYTKSVSDLNSLDCENIKNMYDNEFSVLEISDIFQIPAPSIIKLLMGMGIKRVYHAGRKYDILKQTLFTKKQQEFIVGTMLGDGCIRSSGKLPRLCLVHSKKHEAYFFWKLSQLDKFFNLWREQVHPRKKSTLLYSETLQHSGLKKFESMFYDENRKKHVPSNLDMYMTPYSLAVWFLDDGTLNGGANHRIHTNCFIYSDQIILRDLLKRCFGLDCKIIQRKDEQYILSFNRHNTVKLSNIIDEHVIPSMRYKLRMTLNRSSTTTCQTFNLNDDIV